jgi:hypothetical protein
MSYLSLANLPLDNFSHLAQNTATMTQDYARVQEEIKQHSFPLKLKILEITSIALVALSLLAITMISLTMGLFFASLATISLTTLTSQMNKQKILISKLEQKAKEIDRIVQSIIRYLQKVQIHKTETLIDVFNFPLNSRFYDLSEKEEAEQQLEDYAHLYDEEILGTSNPDDEAKCQEYTKMIHMAQSILEMSPPNTISPDSWNKLQKASFIFLHGEGSSYLLPPGECWSKQKPYIKLEMESPNKQWVAKQY